MINLFKYYLEKKLFLKLFSSRFQFRCKGATGIKKFQWHFSLLDGLHIEGRLLK